MAATLDINLLSKRIISFNVIKDILNSYGVDINTISSIDNWMWENEKQIENLNYITKIIEIADQYQITKKEILELFNFLYERDENE